MTDVKIIGVAGGSCSGKTLLVQSIYKSLGVEHCSIIEQDSYYFGRASLEDDVRLNFDHPDSIEFDKLHTQLLKLSEGEKINVPIYDFKSHMRSLQTNTVSPSKIVFVEGTLILTQDKLVDLFDRSYYIECDEELRKSRRHERDARARGRTSEGVEQQFREFVSPMHKKYVSPSKLNADCILNQQQCDNEILNKSSMLLNFCLEHIANT